ncbi:MAG: PEPxxWA-CTERM sorting domain-containing protein [Usitatibacter sp.]
MSHPIRTLSLALLLAAAATAASAQTNPAARGSRDSFYFGSIHGAPQAPSTQSLTTPVTGPSIGRPVGRFGPVTPVPEPSEWAMMLAGLALVGFIVRRNSKRS